jgi:hypothetical protein
VVKICPPKNNVVQAREERKINKNHLVVVVL